MEENEVVYNEDSELRKMIMEYVLSRYTYEDELVTEEMILEVLIEEIPDIIFILSEENFFRGYEQALIDLKSVEDK